MFANVPISMLAHLRGDKIKETILVLSKGKEVDDHFKANSYNFNADVFWCWIVVIGN